MDDLLTLVLDQVRRSRDDIQKQIEGIQTRCGIILAANGLYLTLILNVLFDNEKQTKVISQVESGTIPYTEIIIPGNVAIQWSLIPITIFLVLSIYNACGPLLLDREKRPVVYNPLKVIDFHSGRLMEREAQQKLIRLTNISRQKFILVGELAFKWFRLSMLFLLVGIFFLYGLFGVIVTNSLFILIPVIGVIIILAHCLKEGFFTLGQRDLFDQIKKLEKQEDDLAGEVVNSTVKTD